MGFLVLFYVVAVGTALGLLSIPYFLYTVAHRVHVQLTLICALGAGAILWSLVPRGPAFQPPGPLLTEEEHPRLFATIRDVARRMDAEMPAAVYLIPDVNAFVAQVGGFLGFGGRRVMGIGLGLLSVDNLSQFRATVAHEFGHFKGGETKLSGLIYATRAAMGRTLENLGQSGRNLLQLPFAWMLRMYMRITQAISRQQELVADEWSLRIAGKQAHITGLRQEGMHGVGFSLFMDYEVLPLGRLGVVPDNFFEGYRRYIGSSGWQRMQPKVKALLAERKTDPYDSHPGLEERIAFAEKVEVPDQPMDETPSYTLLSDVEALEKRYTDEMRPQELKLIPWSETGTRWSVLWNETANRVQARVPDFSLARVPVLLEDAAARESFAEAVNPRLVGYKAPDRDARVRETVGHAVSAYLASILGRHGLAWTTSPGESLKLERHGTLVDPTALVEGLLAGTRGLEELERVCSQHAVAGDATWKVQGKEHEDALAPRAPVKVQRAQDGAEVRAPLARLGLPQCCALCCGSLAGHVETDFRVGGVLSDSGHVTFEVPTCEAHAQRAHEAFRVKGYEQGADLITLEVPNAEYAELLQRCNT
ncbi:M48 family metallopeptidase [Archangium sp.]|uniref:M48 family metallopeptidase n=1 Tax=Archangium sp. TaxID=1872627 RepID=UPI002ED96A54